MLLLFLKERAAWIGFFVILLICINVLFNFDSGFSEISVSYFNIVTISLFGAFLIWRYFKEVSQLNNFLGNLEDSTVNLSTLEFSLSPFQEKYMEITLKVISEKELSLNSSKVKLLEDKEDLLSWVHEMKTPLTAMKLMVEQVEDYKTRTKLENEWMRLHLLLDQQLHNTRIDTIEKDNRLERFILRNVVTKEIRDFQSWCLEKEIGFEMEGLDREVVSDKKWLGFIIRQIISNAIKYSHQGDVIKVFVEQNQTGHIQLHFQDFGLGIKKEDLPRLFEKSYTGTIGRTSSNSSGMGLYLAKNAATKLGITLAVNSTVNEGTIVTIQFPLENEYQKTIGR